MSGIIGRVLATVLIGVASGIVGLIIGAFIGGNVAQQFVFNGVRGYEATGQLGLMIAAVIGLFAGWWFLFKRRPVSSRR